MPASDDITVRLWTPQPTPTRLAPGLFSLPALNVTISNTIGNGFEAATIELPYAERDIPPAWIAQLDAEYRDLAHLVIADSRTLWVGQAISPIRRAGGVIAGIEAIGYGDALDRDHFEDDENQATVPGGQLIRLALEQAFSWIGLSPAYYGEPGREFTVADLSGGTVAQIVNQVVRAGGDDGDQWDFQLWDDPSSPTGVLAHLRARVRPSPSQAEYREAWDSGVDIRYDAREICTHARVRYTDSDDGTEDVTDWYPALDDTSIQSRYGIPRNRVELDGGTLSATEANWYAVAYWTEYSRRRYTGTITRRGREIRLASGGSRSGRYVRSGEAVVVEGLPADESSLLIHRAEWSSDGDETTLALGQAITDPITMIQYATAALRGNRSADTGARR